MNILLWVLQVLLAVAFLAHGVMMLNPPPDIAVQMNAAIPRWFSVFIGVSEVLAAIGLTLPGVARVMPWLVSWAAGGMMIVMISATVFHISPVATQAFLLCTIVGTIGLACVFVARLRNAYGAAERKLQLQAWQLRQIMPDDSVT